MDTIDFQRTEIKASFKPEASPRLLSLCIRFSDEAPNAKGVIHKQNNKWNSNAKTGSTSPTSDRGTNKQTLEGFVYDETNLHGQPLAYLPLKELMALKGWVCVCARVLPVLRCQFERLVDHSVGNGDADAGASRLNLLFTPLQQHLVVPLDAQLLLLVWRHEPPSGWDFNFITQWRTRVKSRFRRSQSPSHFQSSPASRHAHLSRHKHFSWSENKRKGLSHLLQVLQEVLGIEHGD